MEARPGKTTRSRLVRVLDSKRATFGMRLATPNFKRCRWPESGPKDDGATRFQTGNAPALNPVVSYT